MLLRGTAVVSLLTLLSRVFGFVRDLLVAKLLGASLFADAFFVAFRIPNLLRSFVAEGALTSAFVPVFSSSLKEGRERANRTFREVAGFLLCITIPLSVLGIIFAERILDIIAPGFATNSETFTLGVRLTRLMMPYIACVSIIALLNATLNALGVFGTSAWAQVIMNIVLIIGALLAFPLTPESATVALAVSVLIGGVVQVVSQIPAMRRAGLPLLPSINLRAPEIREVVRLMIPATIGASVYQITIFLATLLASLLPEGSVSWLFYADRVAQFPIGIFSVALASVLLPALSSATNARSQDPQDTARFNVFLSNALRYTSFIIIPLSGCIYVLAIPITQLLFERGAFSHESTIKTSLALQALAIGLWATSSHSMIVRAFFAKKDTVTPTLIGLAALVTNLSLSLVLMGSITAPQGDVTRFLALVQGALKTLIPYDMTLGHVGLATASSAAAYVSLLLTLLLYGRKIGVFPWREFLLSMIRSTGAMAVFVVVTMTLGPISSSPLIDCLSRGSLAAVIFLATHACIRSQELTEVVGVVRRKFGA